MYEIIYEENVDRFLKKLPKDIRERIVNKIKETKNDPFHYFVRLKERSEYKLRVGDYRIIADIENNNILIHVIGHRKNVYKFNVLSFFFRNI